MIFLIILTVLIFFEVTFLTVRNIKKTGVKTEKRKIFIDTSGLIDGRILDIAKTGFLGDDLFITRSALHELQLLADGKDPEKRNRARFGMDIANELERVVTCNTEIYDDPLDRTPVDDRLIDLAKENGGMIYTCDFNLQKVAEAEHVEVLNPNLLASSLLPKFLPGNEFRIKITSVGQNAKQGVGYLSEGTMVVVEKGSSCVGKTVDVIFEKFIQTNSGRMIFAKLKTVADTKRTAAQKRAAAKKTLDLDTKKSEVKIPTLETKDPEVKIKVIDMKKPEAPALDMKNSENENKASEGKAQTPENETTEIKSRTPETKTKTPELKPQTLGAKHPKNRTQAKSVDRKSSKPKTVEDAVVALANGEK